MNASARFLFSFSLLGLLHVGCGGDSGEPDDGTGGSSASGGSSPGDGDGDGDGSGGTGGGSGGSGDGDAPTGSLTERAQNLDVSAELSFAATLCETEKLEMRYSYDLEMDNFQGSQGKIIEESSLTIDGRSESYEAVFWNDDGFLTLTWDSPSATPSATPISGELVFNDPFDPLAKCFTGYASLAQEVEGESYYVFVATQFADSGDSGCGGITPSTLGLVHGCISTATY